MKLNVGAAITAACMEQKTRDLCNFRLGYDVTLFGGPADGFPVRFPLGVAAGAIVPVITIPIITCDGRLDYARYGTDGRYLKDDGRSL